MTLRSSIATWRERLAKPVDGASLGVFRLAFGAIMVWEVVRYYQHGWISAFWIEPTFHFTFHGFEWVRPWPGAGMYVHFLAMGVLAGLLALGMWCRVVAPLFWLAFTYIFLIEQARYLNHFYAASLFAFLLAITPGHAALSLDAWRARRTLSGTVPTWALWILRAQMAVVYFYGGVAKINADWLRGEPMRTYLIERSDIPVVGFVLRHGMEVPLFSYSGLLFDLLVVPALLSRRTRPYAFVAAIAFHFLNSQLFILGIFPAMAVAATTLFFDPDWPRAAFRWVAGRQRPDPAPSMAGLRTRLHPALLAFVAAYVVIQLVLPLRHWVYPGEVSWNEEGHHFSWRMKLRSKQGTARFLVTDPQTLETRVVRPEAYLAGWQVGAMVGRPEMLHQFARLLGKQFGNATAPATVRADVMISLNGRAPERLVDPTVDLAALPRVFGPSPWITPGPFPRPVPSPIAGQAAASVP